MPTIRPNQPLPFSPRFPSTQEYVRSLLEFSQNTLFQTLCGGVHILDFFTREKPHDLYTTVLPREWREYFAERDIDDILDLLMRRHLDTLEDEVVDGKRSCPRDLRDFISEVRDHCLRREFTPVEDKAEEIESSGDGESGLKYLKIGMKPKKLHEVENFSRFLYRLVRSRSSPLSPQETPGSQITHIVDFGSGQGYLPRILASRKYGFDVVAVESKQSNIVGALSYDQLASKREAKRNAEEKEKEKKRSEEPHDVLPLETTEKQNQVVSDGGSVQYILKWIEGGDLSGVVGEIKDKKDIQAGLGAPAELEQSAGNGCPCLDGCSTRQSVTKYPTSNEKASDKKLLVVSLHSCGNLVHHALKSIVETPQVKAVAVIGCCYNLMTEKSGITYKPPFRDLHPRLVSTSAAADPLGFPLSDLLTSYKVSLNITARMMACQAPQNWTKESSSAFFTRHFYRALLQKIFVDKGVVPPPKPLLASADETSDTEGNELVTLAAAACATQPIIIGSLRKKCYTSFTSYVSGALNKLGYDNPSHPRYFRIPQEEVEAYEKRYLERGMKKELSIMWSLMAFCAGVVESLILVDRWRWLVEQDVVGEAWVESVFEYEHSPRNLVVVGIKKRK